MLDMRRLHASIKEHSKSTIEKYAYAHRRLLRVFACAASRTQLAFRLQLRLLIVRRGRKRDIVGSAHKRLRTILFVPKRGEFYRDSTTDHQALSVQRNALWNKGLTRFGSIPALA